MTYRNENVTKINDANDTKIKKKTNLSFFSGLFTNFFWKNDFKMRRDYCFSRIAQDGFFSARTKKKPKVAFLRKITSSGHTEVQPFL